ncbi:MAG: hypothetical protein IPP02_04860 [Chitinophagaceae bacterium]|jgi:hypothetical protein|nr:hypothetical protein [Chitinophagaceae bacterium]MBK9660644.1 hypothetical protein [Chitinophagaceae bacterium]MBK9937716.1 hypothetical protein [Chitinophagaceae bacterium]MBL0068757.1 hypothetical protein [Chitinophagaceae bacterium]MBP6478933.1 hypothetical protein [Chitinophagaceae bacterium]
MKKTVSLIIFITIAFSSFSQDTITTAPLTRQDYLQKSKNQKTTANILRYGGAALAVTSLLLLSDDIGGVVDPTDNDNFTAATVLICVGAAAAIISIPLRNAARKNEQQAMSLSFKNLQAPQLTNKSIVQRALPSLTLKINL